MIQKYKNLNVKEVIRYIFVGVLTTVVGLSVYYGLVLTVLSPENPIQLQLANIASWLMAATFAYVANRKIVFNSYSKNIIREMKDFYLARIGTLLLEAIEMFILVTVLGWNDKISKIIVTFTVIIANYFLSKLWVFNKKI